MASIKAMLKKVEVHNGWESPSSGLLQRHRALSEYMDAIVSEEERLAEVKRRAELGQEEAAAAGTAAAGTEGGGEEEVLDEIAADAGDAEDELEDELEDDAEEQLVDPARDYFRESVAALKAAAAADSKYKKLKAPSGQAEVLHCPASSIAMMPFIAMMARHQCLTHAVLHLNDAHIFPC